MDPILLQWIILIVFGLGFLFLAPRAKSIAQFFYAESEEGKQPNLFLLTSSLVISWIFAKSITNAANLGLAFGFVGGLSYAVYYFSFITAGLIIYQLRVKGNFTSIHHFLSSKFGRQAVIIFSLLIGFRLFNEVWSNTMIIGSYFGEIGSQTYYVAILVFTLLTLAYSLKGGMRSSLLTDAIQMVFFGVLLFIIFGFIFPREDASLVNFISSGEWKMSTGMNLLFAALLQVFSYPFHDPVLTDRGFISSPSVTRKSFLWASVIGFVFILLFSFVGIFAQSQGLQGQATVQISKILGIGAMLSMNLIMITSAASTIDSTFSSFAKLSVLDIAQKSNVTVKKGRIAMVIITVLGTIPVFMNPEILSATTVSGTMVMGLAPVFLFWNRAGSAMSFYLPVLFGILVGIIQVTGNFPEKLIFTTGKYADLLWANLWGLIGCFILFFIAEIFFNGKAKDQ